MTNEAFLAELAKAAPPATWLWVNRHAGNPDALRDKQAEARFWNGGPRATDGGTLPNAVDMPPVALNAYFSVAALKAGSDTRPHKTKACFARLLVLVLDDVVLTTVDGEMSYVVETSPGNHQAGIFLDTQDPDCENLALVSSLVTKMADAGLVRADTQGNSAVRYARLPHGANGKRTPAFMHRVTLWQPEVRVTLAVAAHMVGIDLEEARASVQAVQVRADEAEATGTPLLTGTQAEKLTEAVQRIMSGSGFHGSINTLTYSVMKTGMAPGAAVNLARALMNSSNHPRDDRWKNRYAAIPKSVEDAVAKGGYRPYTAPAAPAAAAERFEVDEKTGAITKKALFRSAFDLASSVKPASWVVKGFLEADALAVMFGAPGDGKSFIAVDVACCVATGTAWHGSKVQKGPVIYLAGEGMGGFGRRLSAWQKASGVSLEGAPLHVSTRSVQFFNEESAQEAVDEVELLCAGGPPPSLVIIDTVARSFIGGDENSNSDMSLFINAIDTKMRQPWGAHVLMVHHSGHENGRARGATALKGVLDQEFGVAKSMSGLREFSCSKMKDAIEPPLRAFKLVPLVLGEAMDDFGDMEQITSCVMRLVSAEDAPVARVVSGGVSITPANVVMHLVDGWPGVAALAAELGVGLKAANMALKACHARGLITKTKEGAGRDLELTAKGRRLNVQGDSSIPAGDSAAINAE